MNFEEKLFENFRFNTEKINTDEYISQKEQEINYKFSEKYIEFMKKCNGGFGHIGEGDIDIWGLEEVIDFYDNCEMEQYITFASDGCGMYLAFERNCNQIISLPSDDLSYDNPKEYSESFEEMFTELYRGKQFDVWGE